MNNDYLVHHGVKGMRWGVRRYQYKDGSLTPQGYKHYGYGKDGRSSRSTAGTTSKASSKLRPRTSPAERAKQFQNALSKKFDENVKKAKSTITGRMYVDEVLKAGTSFSRIQTSKDFEQFAFYATYKKRDIDKYMGLFGTNLRNRAEWDAKKAEREAKKSGTKESLEAAKAARTKSDNLKVYQLKISATKNLRVPSDENASHITHELLMKDKAFRKNVVESIKDSKAKMKRPSQQLLFNQAERALSKDPARLSASEKTAIYKALNLSLTNHNEYEVAAQNTFYNALKKKGYNALLDYNDREYSSYHAKRPMIVFDLDAVKLSTITETNPKVVEKLNKVYSTERIAREAISSTLGVLGKIGEVSMSDVTSALNRKFEDYYKR